MLDFNHPNVLTLLGVCFDTEHQLPLIILPYMANGDLKSYLRSERKIANRNDEFPEVCIIEVTFNLHYPSLGYTGFQRGFSNENLCLKLVLIQLHGDLDFPLQRKLCSSLPDYLDVHMTKQHLCFTQTIKLGFFVLLSICHTSTS